MSCGYNRSGANRAVLEQITTNIGPNQMINLYPPNQVTPLGYAQQVTPLGYAQQVTPLGYAQQVTPLGYAQQVMPLGSAYSPQRQVAVPYNNFYSTQGMQNSYIKSASYYASSAMCPAQSYGNAIAAASRANNISFNNPAGLSTMQSPVYSMQSPLYATNVEGGMMGPMMMPNGVILSAQEIRRAPCCPGPPSTLSRMVQPGASPNQATAFNCQ
jgi:hypothetical protein